MQQRSQRAHTRRNVLLTAAAAAAVVASVVWGPGIVDSLSGPGPHPSDRLPPAVGRAIDLAVDARPVGSILAHSPRLPDGPSRRHPPATADAPSRLVIGVEN